MNSGGGGKSERKRANRGTESEGGEARNRADSESELFQTLLSRNTTKNPLLCHVEHYSTDSEEVASREEGDGDLSGGSKRKENLL